MSVGAIAGTTLGARSSTISCEQRFKPVRDIAEHAAFRIPGVIPIQPRPATAIAWREREWLCDARLGSSARNIAVGWASSEDLFDSVFSRSDFPTPDDPDKSDGADRAAPTRQKSNAASGLFSHSAWTTSNRLLKRLRL